MLRSILIGNLGADAEVQNYNGQKFLTFNVADTRRYTDTDGQVKEDTQWVSCSWNNFNEKLIPFLVKGRTIYVEGRGSSRCYSSKKLRSFTSSPIIFVDRVELVGAQPSAVPRQLFTEDGELVEVITLHSVSAEFFAHANIQQGQSLRLLSSDQRQFELTDQGFINPVKDQPEAAEV